MDASPSLNDIATLFVQQRGVPPTAENVQRASQILAQNPEIAKQVYWSTSKSSLPDAMYLGDDFGAPTTMNADAQPSAPTGKGATDAAQAVPPPTSSTDSQSTQQQTGESGKGSMPDAVPLIPLVAPAAVAGSQAASNKAMQGSVDEGIMNEMLSPSNATEQGILQQIDAADQAATPSNVQQIGDTTYQPVQKGVVKDTTSGALYRMLDDGTVLDAANNVVDPKLGQRIARALRGIF